MSIQTQQPCCTLSTTKQYEKLVADANLQLETSNNKINSLNNQNITLKQQIKQLEQQIHNIRLEHKIDCYMIYRHSQITIYNMLM